jgi:hypothetical protein
MYTVLCSVMRRETFLRQVHLPLSGVETPSDGEHLRKVVDGPHILINNHPRL